MKNQIFPVPTEVKTAFEDLKEELQKAAIFTIKYDHPLIVETDASDIAVAATLNQDGRPIAFFSRTLSPSERHQSAIEKEATAIIEAIRKWKHYLCGNYFTLITDQRSISYIFKDTHDKKIKNDKIQRWKLELASFKFDIQYRPGNANTAADTLSRGHCATMTKQSSLKTYHDYLCHPGVTRLLHYVRSKNLPFSVEEVRQTIQQCRTCNRIKPQFYKEFAGTLIKATQPFERISVDFKGPLPSATRNKYLLTMIDEYSRFPFAFPCPDMTSKTVIKCFDQLFFLFGTPSYIHSDRGSSFMSTETTEYLHSKGIATSRTTPYNAKGNGQIEKLNKTLWQAILLALDSGKLELSQWESVLPQALHSIRSLLCTSTNETPHERIFKFNRRSPTGTSLPTWLQNPGKVLLKSPVRSSKFDPLVQEVELISCNPQYAHIRFPNGREETVSLRQLAPKESSTNDYFEPENGILPQEVGDSLDLSPGSRYVPETISNSQSPTPMMYNQPEVISDSQGSHPMPEANIDSSPVQDSYDLQGEKSTPEIPPDPSLHTHGYNLRPRKK
ncbi:uncharacterized protein LOC129924424 [Biomphalaria glabrata]|uniref:Uncharacterized protein LOC129924424 n=1 Tax=Biomphalaria glabrata TaxID=6526 RepID=A0A9W2ZIB3_BIOGL|nr:uncharacterized protein LOC129924424 [Biomphalaria glabrata]